MNVVDLIRKNADIYDALADYYNIDLITHNTTSSLLDVIDFEINSRDSVLEAYDEDDCDRIICDRIMLSKEIATLAMVKGFINIMLEEIK